MDQPVFQEILKLKKLEQTMEQQMEQTGVKEPDLARMRIGRIQLGTINKIQMINQYLHKVLGIVAIVVWYVMHGSYIPSILKPNCTVNLTFSQSQIFFTINDHR